jgi:tetratricopeptide (TPR) repeat protein
MNEHALYQDLPKIESLDQKSKEIWLELSAQTISANLGPKPCQVNNQLAEAADKEPQSPVSPAYRLWRADNLAREGRYREALKAFDDAIDTAQSARRFFPQVDPIRCSLLHKAQAAALGGDAKVAIATYQELAKASAENDRAESLFQAGLAAELDGKDDQAAHLYDSIESKRPSSRTDDPYELARRARQRLQDPDATYLHGALVLADLLTQAIEKSDVKQLDRYISKTHFAIGPLGGHTRFEDLEFLDHFYRDLLQSDVNVQRKLVGTGDKLYLLTRNWNGEWFRGDLVCLLSRAPKGWQWTGIGISQAHDMWVERWRPAEIQTNQALPFELLAPWPAKESFKAGGLTGFLAKQAAIVAAGPILGAAMAAGFARNACGFGPRGFYYNQGPTHDEEDAFAIDFTRYRRNIPYDNESGGTPVLAARGGMVVNVQAGKPSGDSSAANLVEIVHADPKNPSDTNRYRSRYLHLAGPLRIPVSPMMAVIAGQRLGLMDDTGNSVLDHLHFSIHDRTLSHPKVSYGRSVRPSPMNGVRLADGDSGACVSSTNLERSPGLNFSPSSISFGLVPIGDIRTRTLAMENTTGKSVEVSFAGPQSGSFFSWRAFKGTLANGEKKSILVEFIPRGEGSVQATLTVTSTALSSPRAIKLSGKGIGGLEPL